MTYLVPTKPVLQSTTKIAGAARAANLSKSCVMCRALLPNHAPCGNSNRAGPPAHHHITGIKAIVAQRHAKMKTPALRGRCGQAEVRQEGHHSSGQGSTIFQTSVPFLI